MAHRVRIVRVRPAERRGKGIGPRLLNVERDSIREQRFEPFRGDFWRIQVEAIRLCRLEIEPKAGELIHDRASERSRRAHQVEEQSIHHRECADEHERERIILDEGPYCGQRVVKRLWLHLPYDRA